MHLFILLLFALALVFSGGLFSKIFTLMVRVIFLLVLAAMFIHP